MFTVFIIANEGETARELQSVLAGEGFICSIAPNKEKALEQITEQAPDLVVVEMNGQANQSLIQELSRGTGLKRQPPIMALADKEILSRPDIQPGVDDFIVKPFDVRELVLRARRLVEKNHVESAEVIRCGNLAIDLAKCEVAVGGRLIELTFKEYELLKFLAKDRGRVFTRQTLLNKVWGYDYYGGDRTIDVHIRRLRSKLENSGDTFIETVRNIGYRFKKDVRG